MDASRFATLIVNFCLTSFLSLAAAFGVQSDEADLQLKLTDNTALEGQLHSLTDSEIKFQTESDSQSFSLADVMELRFANINIAAGSKLTFRLRDGSTIVANQATITDRNVTLETISGWTTTFSAVMLEAIELEQFDNDAQRLNQWQKILTDTTRTSDAIVVVRDGELETIEGRLGDLADDKIGFTIGDRSANIELTKIVAAIFYQPTVPDQPAATAMAKLTDGSRIKLQTFTWADNILSVKTVGGQPFEIPRAAIGALDFAMGRDMFLDDLVPTTNDWKPWLASNATVGQLRWLNLATLKETVTHQPLTLMIPSSDEPNAPLQLQKFLHGFAIRSGGKLAFSLDENYSRLTGWIGFDPAADPSGCVLLTVRVDSEIVVEEVLRKRDMKRPLRLDVPLQQSRRIVFQVDYQDGRTVGDQLHAVEMKASK